MALEVAFKKLVILSGERRSRTESKDPAFACSARDVDRYFHPGRVELAHAPPECREEAHEHKVLSTARVFTL
jgi:hypothetical protein